MIGLLKNPEKVRFADSVSIRIGPERGFLFDQKSGRIYSLNASGAFAALKINEGKKVAQVIKAVVEEFDVDAETAFQDFTNFVALLFDEGLVFAHE